MIVLDTHAWLWWVSEPDSLSHVARNAIDQTETVGICPISCWELATKVSKGKLTLDREVRVWVRQALAHRRVTVLDISPDIAVTAGGLGGMGFHGDPADRMIVATAMHHGVGLVTKDHRIRSFDRVHTIW